MDIFHPLTLALGGGGAKSAAQAGVLAVLEEAGLPIGPMVGVSGGGIVALLYGAGYSPLQIRDYFSDTELMEMWMPDPKRQTLFGGDKIRARVEELVNDKTFADLRVPVTAMAMDFHTGSAVRLNSGSVAEAFLATMALPGLFPGVPHGEQLLIDCGMINILPVDVARALGPRVVAVDILHHTAPDESMHFFEQRGPLRNAMHLAERLGLANVANSIYQTAKFMWRALTEYSLATYPPDVLIRPAVGEVGLFGFGQAEFAYHAGAEAARAALPRLREVSQQADVFR